jgi:hypothetical protein
LPCHQYCKACVGTHVILGQYSTLLLQINS